MKRLILYFLFFFIVQLSLAQCIPYQVFITGNDVSCNGYNDGSIIIDSVGGTPPYQYYWQGPYGFNSNSTSISSLAPGTYQLTVVDANSCPSISAIAVISQPMFSISLSSSNLSCAGSNDGSIAVNVNGGVAPFNYSWNPPNNNASNISNLGVGNYSTIVTDANGCIKSDSVSISSPTPLLISLDYVTPVSCFGGNNGEIRIIPSGGTGSYSYFWQGPNNYVNPNNTKKISFLYAGNYTVTVTDQNNCQSTLTINVAQPTALTVVKTIQHATCYGYSNGSISVSVSGGTPNYSYQWSNGNTTVFNQNLAAGVYSLTVTDFNNCQKQVSYQVNQPNALSIVSSVVDVLCNGENNGQISINTSGGNLPYSFLWSNGASTEDIQNLTANNYFLNITDNKGCILQDSFVVNEPTELILSMDSTLEVNCFGTNNGQAWLSANGGSSPYSFSWSDGVSNVLNRSDLYAGNYTVYLVDSNLCTDSVIFTMQQPNEIQVFTTLSHHLCYGDNSAGITIDSLHGGLGTLNYNWSNNNIGSILTNLAIDSINLLITDSVNCSKSVDYYFSQPPPLGINFTSTPVSCSGFSDGILFATPFGGTGSYQYLWSNAIATSTILNVPQGTYWLNITDNNNCTFTGNAIVASPAAILSSFSQNISVSCHGYADGMLLVNSTGGTSPYSYSWSNGGVSNFQDSLDAGVYSVTTIDSHNCNTTISATITEPNTITANVQIDNVSCFGGNDGIIDISVNGGTPPYYHQWSNGAFTEDIMAAAGIYSDSIIDNNGCKTILVDTISEPLAISNISQIQSVSCFGNNDGAINLIVTGGTPPYSFDWSSGHNNANIDSLLSGIYSVQITDMKNCTRYDTFFVAQPSSDIQVSANISNVSCFALSDGTIDISVLGGTLPYQFVWSNNNTSEDLANISVGNYIVHVIDNNGCVNTNSFSITQPDSIHISLNVSQITCNGANNGIAQANISGGLSPYQFLWSNSTTQQSITSLASGYYWLQITDSNGCNNIDSFQITEPNTLVVNLVTSDVSCFGANDGNITSNVAGGTAPYSYLWNNGSNGNFVDSLSVGIYSVTVTDNHQCTAIVFDWIQEPQNLYASSLVSNVKCNGGSDGWIDLSVSGGTAPYSFLWSNGSTGQDLLSVTAGNYWVQIIDANQCELTISDTIRQPDFPIVISATISDVNCFGASNGSIDLSVLGGNPPYSFIWSNGFVSEDISNLIPSFYSVVVIDANNCLENFSASVNSVSQILVNPTIKNESCIGSGDGEIALQIIGGFTPYHILWNNGDTASFIHNLIAGNYSVSITDSVNCSMTKNITITAGESIALSFTTEDLKCFGDSTGSILVDILGGTPPYSVIWADGDTNQYKDNLNAAWYELAVIDALGCQKNGGVQLYEPLALSVNMYGDNATCLGINDGNVFTEVSGGKAPYTYLWNNSNITSELLNIVAGEYVVEITDSNLCKITAKYEVLMEEDCISISTAFTPNGDGVNDYWTIRNVENFQNVSVSVFDANGFVYFQSDDYDNSWNGTYKGNELESNTYYYFVMIDNQKYTGSISIIR